MPIHRWFADSVRAHVQHAKPQPRIALPVKVILLFREINASFCVYQHNTITTELVLIVIAHVAHVLGQMLISVSRVRKVNSKILTTTVCLVM
jgi:hypothetical protein